MLDSVYVLWVKFPEFVVQPSLSFLNFHLLNLTTAKRGIFKVPDVGGSNLLVILSISVYVFCCSIIRYIQNFNCCIFLVNGDVYRYEWHF